MAKTITYSDLSSQDRRLLAVLDLNARLTQAELVRKTGYSADVVSRRIERLKEAGIIKGFNAIVDVSQLGLTPYAVYSRLEGLSAKQYSLLLNELEKEITVYWVAALGGKFDILMAFQARSPFQLAKSLAEIERKSRGLRDSSIAIRVSAIQFPRKYLSPDRASKQMLTFKAGVDQSNLTPSEEQLLRAVTSDVRAQVTVLAKRTKLSRPTVYNHLRSLEQRGVIQGYTTLIDCTAYGYSCYLLGLTLKRLDPEIRKRLFDFGRRHPNVTFYVETLGCWHAELHVEVPNQRFLQDLLTELQNSCGKDIADIEIIVCFDYYTKYVFSMPGDS
jgi:DNA-binding Lrp family transcriptional regulator